MLLENRVVNKQNISNSFRGILRISPSGNGQDSGFIGNNTEVVSDSVGMGSALSLGTNSVLIRNHLGVSGDTSLSGNISITGGSVSISPENNTISLCGADIDMETPPEQGDILYYDNNKFSPQSLEKFVLGIVKKYNLSMVGHIMIWPSDTIPTGWLLCDGTRLNQADYPDLFDVLGHMFTDTEQDNPDVHFRLPDFRNIFLRGNSSSRKLGSYQESGAPNIWGMIFEAYYGAGRWKFDGAFSEVSRHGWSTWGGGGGDPLNINIKFDASKVSKVYKADVDEIRPNNISVNFIIKY